MVQILPQATSLRNQIGQALGGGLSSGIQKGSEVGFQRGMLQNALKGLENLPPGTTPFELASQLMQATAGIPGSERYVGQLYPLLLGQLRSQQAFGEPGQSGTAGQPSTSQISPGTGAGGILGEVIPQDVIDTQAKQYAQNTGTGIEGYNQMQQNLMNRNTVAEQQRSQAERKLTALGVKPDEIPLAMQIGERHKNAKTFDDWVRETNKDFKEYKNLSKSLESASYPDFWRGITLGTGARESRLKELDNTVKRLVDMGFEQDVREKFASSGLSPAEIEERIHPFTPETDKELRKIPDFGPRFQSDKTLQKKEDIVRDFMKKNINPNTSLLAIRDRLWKKGYDWEKIATMMNEVANSPDGPQLSPSQVNELGILEREPPRQSLNYIFRDVGNFIKTFAGQK